MNVHYLMALLQIFQILSLINLNHTISIKEIIGSRIIFYINININKITANSEPNTVIRISSAG